MPSRIQNLNDLSDPAGSDELDSYPAKLRRAPHVNAFTSDLGGVFRESVWYPGQSDARFESRASHAQSTPRQDRWQGSVHRKHWSSIYPDEVNRLADQRADILVTHEAPGYHPHGFEILDDLARSMGVKVSVHGHQHDRLDSSHYWVQQGFKSLGVGLCGITAIDVDGHAEVIFSGDLDHQRQSRGA